MKELYPSDLMDLSGNEVLGDLLLDIVAHLAAVPERRVLDDLIREAMEIGSSGKDKVRKAVDDREDIVLIWVSIFFIEVSTFFDSSTIRRLVATSGSLIVEIFEGLDIIKELLVN